jgi:FKBP12-rapamycin complex-associated protein
MRVLRENNDSLMAVLEAFVYDPLISWRLTAGQEPGGNGKHQGATRSSNMLTVSPW